MQSLEQRAQAMSNDALKQCASRLGTPGLAAGREAARLTAKNDERFVFMIDETVRDFKRAAEIVKALSEEVARRAAA